MHLQGKKIFLRSVLPSDTDLLYRWENDKNNWKVSGTKKPFTKKEIKEFIDSQKDIYMDKQLRLMIELSRLVKKVNGNIIGCIDLFNFREREQKAGIGILIEKKYRKNGYASEALSLLIKYCFEILNLNQIYCNISKNNQASIKLFQKHEFKITGKKKDEYVLQLLNK